MPEIARMPAGRRCFARIDRFECACPDCGRLIFAGIDKKFLPKRLGDVSRARAGAKARPRAEAVLRLYWNPHTQRLACPWCGHAFTLGVVFYPTTHRGKKAPPAPDVIPTLDEVAEMRRLAGGWFVKGGKAGADHANLVVPAGCRCPEGGSRTDPSCPMHGAETLDRPGPPRTARPKYFSEYVAEVGGRETTGRRGGESV